MRSLTSIVASVTCFLALGAASLSFAQPAVVEIDLRIGSYQAGHARGEAAVKRDLQDGKLRLLSWGGLTAPRDDRLESALLRVYAQQGVEITLAGACSSPEEERGYLAGYNAVAMAELERRFGKNVIARLEREAEALAKRAPK